MVDLFDLGNSGQGSIKKSECLAMAVRYVHVGGPKKNEKMLSYIKLNHVIA